MTENRLTRHLRQVDETWWVHCGHAAGLGLRLLGAGVVCLVHALLPCLFEQTASRLVKSLQRDFAARATDAPRASSSALAGQGH